MRAAATRPCSWAPTPSGRCSKLLVPDAEVVTRPRFSTLTYTAPAKVTRLPKRSAVVAFTAQEVYAFAELVRRRRGGAAVVLGALSPRTRNAQVALYQAGEVDYLIATDAIGMGLNMDLHHVALASLGKFDGRERRPLHAHEIGQIAGRAGRHMQDGTFGTTHDVGGLDPKIVEAVETHSFPGLRQLYWRNGELEFGSLAALQDSLDAPPPQRCLARTGDALDHVSLKILARRSTIRERVTSPDGVRLLWSVCQIPDFRKTLTEAHLNLLARVFDNLALGQGLPTDWVADQIARLERTDGDIDALITRLAHIRTWTYVAYREDWLQDAQHWQERARAVEDKLSDALHERLTQRFIDRRTQALLKSLQGAGPLAAIEKDGAILVDGHAIGRIEGLRYELEPSREDIERRALGAAARRILGPEMQRRAKALIAAPDDAFSLDPDSQILWHQGQSPAPIGQLLAGPGPLTPRLELLLADGLSGQAREAIRQRLARWLDSHLATVAMPLRRLQAAAGLEGAGRGLCFLLVEQLGNVPTPEAKSLLRTLGDQDRARLGKLGVRFGVRQVYLPAMIKPRAIALRARLWATHRHARGLSSAGAGRGRVRRRARTTQGLCSGDRLRAARQRLPADRHRGAPGRTAARPGAAGPVRPRARPDVDDRPRPRGAGGRGGGPGLRARGRELRAPQDQAASRARAAAPGRCRPLALCRAARAAGQPVTPPAEGLRLDKWLWQARFFKTRPLAAQLAQKGRIRINQVRVNKPHYRLRPGDVLTFPQGQTVRVVRVLALGTRRGPAPEAQALYEDLASEK